MSLRCGALVIRAAVALGVMVAMLGCATPSERIDRLAMRAGFEREIINGAGFRHVVYLSAHSGDVLHVYIEGDGSPYRTRLQPNEDPTPRRPVMLHLMMLDLNPSVYVGRPCYFGLSEDRHCTVAKWTTGRFGEDIVASQTKAIERLADRYGAASLRIFGHSGGGTIAVLIADRLPRVKHVVTLAGNLDTDAWTALHQYTPLADSLNPVEAFVGRHAPDLLHYAGSEDENIPSALAKRAVQRMRRGELQVVDGFTHTCCWTTVWREILSRIME